MIACVRRPDAVGPACRWRTQSPTVNAQRVRVWFGDYRPLIYKSTGKDKRTPYLNS
jgi:hypothetical protein